MPKEKSCGAVVFKREKDGIKYLLLHYEAGHWDLPKGKQEKNEKEEQTAAREIKEETGIGDIEFVDEFRELVKYFYKSGDETIFKEVVFFLAQSATGHVELSKEHIGYAWMGYEHAYKKLTFNNAKELLMKANKFLDENKK
ncbi:NUDIX domain-containing protein [Candidatus Woesearchaeota archaeon]|nr:NUDIX domain-containing protein [Candidatus Woesearchaeota archaeon]